MVNWKKIIVGVGDELNVDDFVRGEISRDNMIRLYPELRNVIRTKGVQAVRRAAAKALRRRNLV